MIFTARLLTLLAVISLGMGCTSITQPSSAPPVGRDEASAAATPPTALAASPRKLVGRVLAIDLARGFAFVTLTTEPPSSALADGAQLIARTDDLHETARMKTARTPRGRILATQIISGQPTPGDEVVTLAP